MQKHRRTLPREKRMRHIRHVVRVGITNRKDTRHIRDQPPLSIRRKLIAVERNACLRSDVRVLLGREIGEESIPQHGVLPIFEINLEKIVLRVSRKTGVRIGGSPVTEARDGSKCAVLDAHVLQLEVGLPAGELGRGDVAVLRGVGAVDEEHDVGV